MPFESDRLLSAMRYVEVDTQCFQRWVTGMTIHLKPELEAVIQKDVERGPYQSADEFVERAVQMLHEQEQWLADNQSVIAAKVEEGYASAERGELLDPEQVRAQVNERKQAWRNENQR